jgi:integrase
MLTTVEVKAAKPKNKPYRLFDAGGLYLEVQTTGARYWRWKYRNAGKERRLSFGVFPEVSIAEARARRDEARALLRAKIDPSAHRQTEKRRAKVAAANSFEAVAREWHSRKTAHLNDEHRERTLRRLERDVFPYIGHRPIGDIEPPELLEVLRKIEGRGAVESAHRARSTCSQVFRYAIQTDRAKRDSSADLRGAIAAPQRSNFAAVVDPNQIGPLLRAIHGYQGAPETVAALRELRSAEWVEFDLDAAEWRLPAEKMKSNAPHIVPLSRQAVELLRGLAPLTGRGRYLFPSVRGRDRPMSENTINAALRRLGYSSEEMTGHGFRAMASTSLHELGWESDIIERQLAHGERNKVKAAYNRAQHLRERRKMMQAWADMLDAWASGAKVVAGRFGAQTAAG